MFSARLSPSSASAGGSFAPDALAMPSQPRSTLLLLRFAAARWRVPLDEEAVERALDARADGGASDASSLTEELAQVAAVAGFAVHPVSLRGDELLRAAHERSPAFRPLADASGQARWVALLGGDDGKACLSEVYAGAEPRALASAEQAQVLGDEGWLLLEPLRPLEAAAGHGGHEHPSPWQRLVAILRPERGDIGVVVAYAVAVGLLSLAVPIGVQVLVNTVAFGVLRQPVLVLTLLVLVGLGFAGAMQAAQVHVVELLQRRLFVRAAVDTAGRLAQVDMSAFDQRNGPELVNRFFDVVTLQKGVATLLLDGVGIALQVLIGALILGFYHPLLLAFDAILMVSVVIIIVVLGRGGLRTSIAESYAKYDVAAWLEELAAPGGTFHGDGGRRFASQRVQRLCADYLDARSAHFRVVLRQTIATLVLQALASASLLGVGAILVMNKQLSIGQLVAAEIIVSAMLAGTSKLGKLLETAYDLLTSADKLGYLLDIPLERSAGEVPAGFGPASLALRDVSFTYAPLSDGGHGHDEHAGHHHAPHPALEHLSLDVAAGQATAIVGGSGAGRSTLADLILGYRTPSSGAVRFDGVDVRSLRLGQVREHVTLARGAELFEGTVAENVRAGRPGVGPHEMRQALELVELLPVIEALPQGTDQRLPPHGAPLSATQAVLLGLARAVAGAPRLLVVDAALDELDRPQQERLLARLLEPSRPWTLLLLTRHPYLAARLPVALGLDHGRLDRLTADGHDPHAAARS